MSDTQAQIDKLDALCKQRVTLMGKLKRSILVREFYPDAFKHGICNCYVTGNPWTPASMRFVIKTGDGIKHVWPMLDVPTVLWECFKDRMRADTRGQVKEWRK